MARTIDLSRITTAGTIEGWVIERYCGPVVTHAVTGAGLVTEFFAGFTDVFGGRSEAIRGKLDAVRQQATEQLQAEAARLGANWVIGLRVDMDEVSGKGTMMFMVTVSGTAVVAKSVRASASGDASVLARRECSGVQLAERMEVMRLESIRDCRDLELESVRQSIIERRVAGAAPLFLQWARQPSLGSLDRSSRQQVAIQFFARLPPDVASKCLYEHAVIEPVPAQSLEIAILEKLSLLDLERTRALLASDKQHERWWGLQTLKAGKMRYDGSDLQAIDACLAVLGSIPDTTAPVQEVKRLIGKRAAWTCLQGHANSEGEPSCGSCGLDRAGFLQGDVTPTLATQTLTRLRDALSRELGDE